MQANLVKNKKSYYFAFLFKQHKSFAIFLAVGFFGLSVLPYFLEVLTIGVEEYYGNYIPHLPYMMSLTLFVSVISPFIVMNYVYKKNDMDMYFSLPEKRGNLIFQQIIFSWVIVIVPSILTFLLNYTLYRIKVYPFLVIVPKFNLMDYIPAVIMGSLVIIMISVLAILCTTSLFNGLVYLLALHILPLVWVAAVTSFSKHYYGYARILPDELVDRIYFFLVQMVPISAVSSELLHGKYMLQLSIWFAIALAALALAILIFNKHKVERTDSDYMVRGFYPTITIASGTLGLMFILYTILSSEIRREGFINAFLEYKIEVITVFAIGLVMYFVVKLIRKFGRPKIFKTILAYCGIFALSIIMMQVFFYTLLVYPENKVPNLNKVEKVRIDVLIDRDYNLNRDAQDYFNPDKHAYFITNHYRASVNQFKTFEIIDKSDIQDIMILQQDQIKRHNDWLKKYSTGRYNTPDYFISEDDEGRYTAIKIHYIASNGNTILLREYGIAESMIQRLERILRTNIIIKY